MKLSERENINEIILSSDRIFFNKHHGCFGSESNSPKILVQSPYPLSYQPYKRVSEHIVPDRQTDDNILGTFRRSQKYIIFVFL